MLGTLIAGLATGETVAALKRAKSAAVAYAIAGLLGLCGVGFLISAGYIWTSRRLGDLGASLAFAAGFVVLAGIVVLVHVVTAGRNARLRAKRRKSDMAAVGVTAGIALAPTLLKSRSGISAALGSLAIVAAAYAYYRHRNGGTPPE